MDEILRKLLNKVDKKELMDELKNDEEFSKLMGMFLELFEDNNAPTIKIALLPNEDGTTHSLSIETEGSMHSIIFGLAEIVATIMVDMDKKGVLRKGAYEAFGSLVKDYAEHIKNEKEK